MINVYLNTRIHSPKVSNPFPPWRKILVVMLFWTILVPASSLSSSPNSSFSLLFHPFQALILFPLHLLPSVELLWVTTTFLRLGYGRAQLSNHTQGEEQLFSLPKTSVVVFFLTKDKLSFFKGFCLPLTSRDSYHGLLFKIICFLSVFSSTLSIQFFGAYYESRYVKHWRKW